ncbi:YciI family protein [Bacteroidota bacterium]
MQFIVLGYDGKDEKAFERRMAVREKHLTDAKEKFQNGEWLYASGILDNNGKMVGSMIVCDYPSREEIYEKWLNNEAYVTGNVWEKIVVHRAAVPEFLTSKL